MSTGTIHIHDHLVEQCRNGNRIAQNEIYRLYSKPMFNVCLRIVQNREEAEDVLQESFIDAFTKLSSFRGESGFGSWFKRIVINKSINTVNRRKLVFSDLPDNLVIDEPDDVAPDFSPELCTIEDVKKELSKLPDGFRIVFTLYMFEDYSHKQIAEQLGITESTSKSQLNRAKKKLAEVLGSAKK